MRHFTLCEKDTRSGSGNQTIVFRSLPLDQEISQSFYPPAKDKRLPFFVNGVIALLVQMKHILSIIPNTMEALHVS